jgi:RNA polymerase sigma-70 factor (ECF subfamily)
VRTDLELLEAWRAGDGVAGNELVSRHWASVSRFFRSKIGDDGADLISQTLLALVESREPVENVVAFLFSVARRRIIDHLRRRTRSPELDPALSSIADLRTGVETAALRRERADLLRDGLAQIPLDDQIALELAYFDHLTTRGLATVLAIPENTVRSRLSRARDKLRAVLADEEALADLAI